MPTPEYPEMSQHVISILPSHADIHTLLVLRQAEEAIPAWNKYHIIGQILALYLELLHDYNIRLQDVEHGIESPVLAPWLVAKWIADAVDIPRCDADHYVCGRR